MEKQAALFAHSSCSTLREDVEHGFEQASRVVIG